jgi:hypothetical protein
MPIPAQYSGDVYSHASVQRSIHNLLHDEVWPTGESLTAAGQNDCNRLLNSWRDWTIHTLDAPTEASAQGVPSVDLSWFARVMEPTRGPLKPADLMPVIAGVANLLTANYFEEVDRLLKSVKVHQAAPEMLVALLRTTYPVRGQRLRYWPKLLRAVRTELAARNLDAEKILRGLS